MEEENVLTRELMINHSTSSLGTGLVEDERMNFSERLSNLGKTVKSYFCDSRSRYAVMESTSCLIFCVLTYIAPVYIFGMTVNERPIPYQITDNGDVILDLSLTNEWVKNETIPNSLLVILSALPVLIYFLVGFFFGPRRDFHAILCANFVALGITGFITTFFKLYVGRLRPNFYELCGFDKDTLSCTESDHNIEEARISFPSGHSSGSFMAMTLLSLYFLGKVGLQRGFTGSEGSPEMQSVTIKAAYKSIEPENAKMTSALLKIPMSILAVTPMFLAFFISSSRLHDNWHHPGDVIGGALIGFMSSVFAYGLWFPSIYSQFSGIPLHTLQFILRRGNDIEEDHLL